MPLGTPDLHVGVEMANRYADVDGIFPSTLVVASVPTLGRRGSRCIAQVPYSHELPTASFPTRRTTARPRNGVMCWITSDSQSFGGAILSLGLTATPNRSDGTGLRQNFDEIVFDMGIRAGIESGYLVDLRGISESTRKRILSRR